MAGLSLTPTSYVVLGLVATFGPCTSYDMKRTVASSIGYFWPFPHSQLYAEPVRLAELGLLAENQEMTGRKRRTYVLTEVGREALRDWLAEPNDEPTEIRDLSVLKLFFGNQADEADIRKLAEHAVDAHRRRLAEYQSIASNDDIDRSRQRTLQIGQRFEEVAIEFWSEIAVGRAPAEREPVPRS